MDESDCQGTVAAEDGATDRSSVVTAKCVASRQLLVEWEWLEA